MEDVNFKLFQLFQLFFPNFDTKIEKNDGKFHKNQVLAHLRMKPQKTDKETEEVNKSLEEIFSRILSSIEIKV